MKKHLNLLLLVSFLTINIFANTKLDTSKDNWTYGRMYQWHAHTAFAHTDRMAVMQDVVYALSKNALYSVDKHTQTISYHNRLTGLNGSLISQMEYNPTVDAILLSYQNGQFDIIDSDGDVHNVPDLYFKQMSYSKAVNHVYMYGDRAYLSMTFGIIVLDMKKREIEDTYYLGDQGAIVDVQSTVILGDSIYARSSRVLYAATLESNLIDYANWQKRTLPNSNSMKDLCAHNDKLYIVCDSTLWMRNRLGWKKCETPFFVTGLRQTGDNLFVLPQNMPGVAIVDEDYSLVLEEYGTIYDIKQDGDYYWLCSSLRGLFCGQNQRSYYPHGPIDNTAYRMRFFGDRLYVVPGGRWATENRKAGCIMFYEDNRWTNISNYALNQHLGFRPQDLMNVAQDPKDKNHYFVTSYGSGLIEMYGSEGKFLYTPDNSPLKSAAPDSPSRYTRTDGAMYDDQGNLWVLNTSDLADNIHVINHEQKKWVSYNVEYNNERVILHTPGEIMVDRRNPQWKWIPICRYNPGLLLIKDNGTPFNPKDDQVVYRTTWYDQNNVQIRPSEIHSLAQDMDNAIWVGTNAGLFLIPADVDFASSDRCERVIIRRNDGTDLADYLLDNEKINTIVVDGANRKWIGTATSGVFLLSPDGLETIEHFTAENSPLLDNTILSIAIQESTGEVFIGTSDGLISYMSDAIPVEEDFTNIYAYPNPVHPNYKGYVVIKGLMSDTEVRIVDANGNLVKLLQGLGGEVVWDVTNAMGDRVASGVYTAICNTLDGKAYGVTKVLIMN